MKKQTIENWIVSIEPLFKILIAKSNNVIIGPGFLEVTLNIQATLMMTLYKRSLQFSDSSVGRLIKCLG